MHISLQKYRYLLFYKPYGVLSQFTNSNGENQKRTLKDYIPIPDVYPVGRLDWDSEGLMLLTDRGQLQYRLSHPQFQHPRTYWAQVERVPDVDALKQLQQGVMIENYRTGLLWKLFMSCPEIQNGLKKLGFESPYVLK